MPLFLNDTDVKALMSMNDCVDVMEDAFNQAGDGKVWNRPRSRTVSYTHLTLPTILLV